MGNFFTSLTGALGGWMASPWLFLAGAALVASPILIHLLNKRKFKTLDWAAMDFLIEAEKKNHRRIRLENLLLLLLRCLAVLLIGLLLARPFIPSGLMASVLGSVGYERIVLLDDSLSMEVADDGRSAFDAAKQQVADFVSRLASNESEDSFTLILASQPGEPIFNAEPVTDDTAAEIAQRVRDLSPSDVPVNLQAALVEVEKMLGGRTAELNRVVYVLGDLRQRDYAAPPQPSRRAAGVSRPLHREAYASRSPDTEGERSSAEGMHELLRRISEKTVGCFLVDVGGDETANLAIVEIVPQEKALIAGVACEFDVIVRNNGPRDVSQVPVRFTAGDSLPQERTIDNIPAGERRSATFTFTFARADDLLLQTDPDPVRIRAEVPMADRLSDDRLPADNVRYFAARVIRGIPTLIVDGDPSSTRGRAESFYLSRALAPPGNYLSGIDARVATDVEFETMRLDDYQIIYICNLFHLSEGRRAALERWVNSGGSLVFMLGDQIDEAHYNEQVHRDGKGLLPAKLDGIEGDETEQKWAHLKVESATHPMLRQLQGADPAWGERVKVFRWWKNAVSPADLKEGSALVLASFTDDGRTPAIIEKTLGDGRVLMLATPCDADWNDWPADPTYLVAAQDMNRYLTRKSADRGTITVGRPIRQPFDLTEFRLDGVTLTPPESSKTPLQPVRDLQDSPDDRSAAGRRPARDPDPAAASDSSRSNPTSKQDETIWSVHYDATTRRGFYEMELTRARGDEAGSGDRKVLFAANIDPSEGDLRRVDAETLQRDLGEARVRVVTGEGLTALSTDGAKGELWMWVLGAVLLTLCTEQSLAWLFGLRR